MRVEDPVKQGILQEKRDVNILERKEKMSTDHVRNVSGILSHAKAKSETVKQRIDLAIESLMRENLAVNFNSVAARACVSKTTLYNHPEYRTRIESLRCNCIAPKLILRRPVFFFQRIGCKDKHLASVVQVARIRFALLLVEHSKVHHELSVM